MLHVNTTVRVATADASGASVSRSSSGSAPQSAPINLAEPRDRKTQVLLPAETDAQVGVLSLAHLSNHTDALHKHTYIHTYIHT